MGLNNNNNNSNYSYNNNNGSPKWAHDKFQGNREGAGPQEAEPELDHKEGGAQDGHADTLE